MVYNPNYPAAGPWFGPGAPQQGSPTSAGGGTWGSSSARPVSNTVQGRIADDSAYYDAWLNSPMGQRWNQAQEAAAGQSRRIADEQIANAKRNLDLQAQTLQQQGRYQEAQILLQQGTAKLAEQRFKWEQEIKQQELGLQKAEAWTKYSSTPDMYWSQQEFRGALGNAMQGRGPAPIQQQVAMNGSPRMKTMSDFDAIAGPGGSLAGANPSPPMPGGGGAGGAMGAGMTDPRHSAANAVLKALPPSGDTGLDDNDMAALRAVESIYLAAKPGSLERLGAARGKIAQAGLARLGYDPQLMQENYIRSGVGQGRGNAA